MTPCATPLSATTKMRRTSRRTSTSLLSGKTSGVWPFIRTSVSPLQSPGRGLRQSVNIISATTPLREPRKLNTLASPDTKQSEMGHPDRQSHRESKQVPRFPSAQSKGEISGSQTTSLLCPCSPLSGVCLFCLGPPYWDSHQTTRSCPTEGRSLGGKPLSANLQRVGHALRPPMAVPPDQTSPGKACKPLQAC